MELTWYGHSCFKLSSAAGSVVFDPYAPGSVPGLTLPPITADAVICSHEHADHAYREGVRLSGGTPAFDLRRYPVFHDEVEGAKRGTNFITVVDGCLIGKCGDI